MSRFPMIRPELLLKDDVVGLCTDDGRLKSKVLTVAAAATAAAAVAAIVSVADDRGAVVDGDCGN